MVDLCSPLGALQFAATPAWLFWLFAHIYFLIGFRNRLVVLIDWAWAYWTFERSARIVTDIEPTPPRPDDRPRLKTGSAPGVTRRTKHGEIAGAFRQGGDQPVIKLDGMPDQPSSQPGPASATAVPLIVNTAAGGDKPQEWLATLEARCRERGLDAQVLRIDGGDQLLAAAGDAVQRGARLVIAGGGDAL